MMAFIHIRFLDVLDILMVAFLLYRLYLAIKGTAAFNIFMGIFLFYITWIIVKGLKMELTSTIMGQVMAAGVLALVVVFQQEIRKFFMLIGSRYNLFKKGLSFENLFSWEQQHIDNEQVKKIVMAAELMGRSKTGALIVLTNTAQLNEYVETGERINAEVSVALLESIFYKNSPLHDGAVIIQGKSLLAARCVLPVTNKRMRNAQLGLRHRAALGMSMATDAQIIIVSEETGNISYAFDGKLKENINPIELSRLLEEATQK
ncbi:diadenylate cyclase CdaA [Roseimarinus sediminis]|uniref:diadenylate cyclase CdaA n=1 Tax=Roseimarinus sediminis TaxID=1610899 RepID=UPI003D197B49